MGAYPLNNRTPMKTTAIAKLQKRSPTYIIGQLEISDTQRRKLKLGPKEPPRVRDVGEAGSLTVCNSSTTEAYRTGYGEVVQPVRAGAMHAYKLPSLGINQLSI